MKNCEKKLVLYSIFINELIEYLNVDISDIGDIENDDDVFALLTRVQNAIEYKNYDVVEKLNDLDLDLSYFEDIYHGGDGDKLTQMRSELNKIINKLEKL